MAHELCGKRCGAEANHGEADCNQQGRPKLLAYSHPYEYNKLLVAKVPNPGPNVLRGITDGAQLAVTAEFNHAQACLPIAPTLPSGTRMRLGRSPLIGIEL